MGIIAFMRALPSALASKCGRQVLITSSTMFTETDAPGEAPSNAEMVRSGLVMTSVP